MFTDTHALRRPTDDERQAIVAAVFGDKFRAEANTPKFDSYFEHYYSTVCPGAGGDAAIAVDTPVLRTHAGLIRCVATLVQDPKLTFNGFIEQAVGAQRASAREQAHIARVTVEAAFGINCMLRDYYSDGYKGEGSGRVRWEGDVPFAEFMEDAFTTRLVDPSARKLDNSAILRHKSSLKAWKLKKRYKIKLRPTNNLLEHLSYDPSIKVLRVYHQVSFLRAQLEKTANEPLDLSFADSLKRGALPPKLILETLLTFHDILFPIATFGDRRSHAMLKRMVRRHGFDPQGNLVQYVRPTPENITFEYWGDRLSTVHNIVKEPPPTNAFMAWLERHTSERNALTVAIVGLFLAALFGLLGFINLTPVSGQHSSPHFGLTPHRLPDLHRAPRPAGIIIAMAQQDRMHFLAGKKIVVAGCGMAGLSFAIALRKLWDPDHAAQPQPAPELVLLDRDGRRIGPAREGYSLSLNGFDADGGLVACRDLGLLDEVLARAVLTGGHGADDGADGGGASFRIWEGGTWRELLRVSMAAHAGLPTSVVRITRRHLRDVLIAKAEETDAIGWHQTCTAAERLPDGRIRVHISPSSPYGGGGSGDNDGDEEPGRTEDCDLLIAADGAHSKIRASLLPASVLRYAGAVQLGGVGRFPAGLPDPIARNWGMALTGEGVACFFSPVDGTGVVWALSRLEPEGTRRPEVPYDRASAEAFAALQDEALALGRGIGGPFASVVRATEQDSSFVLPARDLEPFAHNFDDNDGDGGGGTAGPLPRGVVFLGDSNHAVSPFAGNGANMALKDGWDLASRLCAGSSLDGAVAAYDALALPRARKTLKTSHERIAMGHCTGWRYWAFRVMLWLGSWFMWLAGR
ncbi:phenazine biosynthesis protein [Purpureocillium lavendulum]|uniref:Phenazine biosynthesis protein n=1 Tax=Purpureocillium lavendulum TaxID=1247861 RepID=A0AB34FNJ1_9HYPO|nr:phenazine biosynthesis protein [Purpureocillium lavendulum]